MTREYINIESLNSLFDPYLSYKCWGATLSFGSLINFEFGEKLKVDGENGKYFLWELSIAVESDEWSIYRDSDELAKSFDVNREILESKLERFR